MICCSTARNLFLMLQDKSLWIRVSNLCPRDYVLRFLTTWFLSNLTGCIKHKCYLVSDEIKHGKLILKDRLVFAFQVYFSVSVRGYTDGCGCLSETENGFPWMPVVVFVRRFARQYVLPSGQFHGKMYGYK